MIQVLCLVASLESERLQVRSPLRNKKKLCFGLSDLDFASALRSIGAALIVQAADQVKKILANAASKQHAQAAVC